MMDFMRLPPRSEIMRGTMRPIIHEISKDNVDRGTSPVRPGQVFDGQPGLLEHVAQLGHRKEFREIRRREVKKSDPHGDHDDHVGNDCRVRVCQFPKRAAIPADEQHFNQEGGSEGYERLLASLESSDDKGDQNYQSAQMSVHIWHYLNKPRDSLKANFRRRPMKSLL